ncbi:hypothetical protein [Streptomyces prunicolor]|uniref:hypothetical protein n=1 Tax=Streptomyces prunicolor TaxID=67348 RepID=UPI0038683F9A
MALGRPPLEEHVLGNVYNVHFDTCVYHQPGIDLLLDVFPGRIPAPGRPVEAPGPPTRGAAEPLWAVTSAPGTGSCSVRGCRRTTLPDLTGVELGFPGRGTG